MLKRRYTYGVHENCLIFNTHHPQSIYVQNISVLLTLDVQFLNKPSYPLEQTMEQKPHRACERTKLKQKQIQARHIQIDHTFRFTPKTTPWYH